MSLDHKESPPDHMNSLMFNVNNFLHTSKQFCEYFKEYDFDAGPKQPKLKDKLSYQVLGAGFDTL